MCLLGSVSFQRVVLLTKETRVNTGQSDLLEKQMSRLVHGHREHKSHFLAHLLPLQIILLRAQVLPVTDLAQSYCRDRSLGEGRALGLTFSQGPV